MILDGDDGVPLNADEQRVDERMRIEGSDDKAFRKFHGMKSWLGDNRRRSRVLRHYTPKLTPLTLGFDSNPRERASFAR